MRLDELIQQGAHVMTVCNACRYCEQYCPVFPAMEQRVAFGKTDLSYLANLCHNCGECLYACQYAPPHEFGINVPRTLAEIRLRSYQDYAWPRALASAFTHHGLLTSLVLVFVLSGVIYVASVMAAPGAFEQPNLSSDFYAVVPHDVMVGIFGSVFLFALIAIGVGVLRFAQDVGAAFRRPTWTALRDAFTLRHLHSSGADCVSSEETRSPWRRWFHHCTFYGFLLSFASTSVAAVYHTFFGWLAPYDYASLPVVLGTLGGMGLAIGSLGLWTLREQRDPTMGDPSQHGLDRSFLALLFLTAVTGLLLLVLRHTPAMSRLLILHLGTVLALFVTLPYGKFVHGFYRVAALFVYTRETQRQGPRESMPA
jgi:citrate/tricarballylate utilization protein